MTVNAVDLQLVHWSTVKIVAMVLANVKQHMPVLVLVLVRMRLVAYVCMVPFSSILFSLWIIVNTNQRTHEVGKPGCWYGFCSISAIHQLRSALDASKPGAPSHSNYEASPVSSSRLSLPNNIVFCIPDLDLMLPNNIHECPETN